MMRILVVSPHLGDAVLSYGGQLAQLADAGHQVSVYTVFAGTPTEPYSPAATELHAKWGLSRDPLAPRRREDRRALSLLGVTPVHGPFLDAIYRKDDNGDWLIGQDMTPAEYGEAEPRLVANIGLTLEKRIVRELNPDWVATCSAIGNHVDHRRVRDAAIAMARRTGIPLLMWADFPYVTCTDAIPELPAGTSPADPVAEPVSEAAGALKSKAVQCYASQLPCTASR
jgi:LmbE family N-acetylglucosaminyl deacetylase